MKIIGNWAIAVPTFYITFVLLMVGVLIFSTFNKVELVDQNYYDKEIVYEKQIDKIRRTNALPEKLLVSSGNGFVLIQFPKSIDKNKLSGKIVFFKPSESKQDFFTNINPDNENKMIFGTDKISKGFWRIKIDWASGDSTYYNEEVVVLI
jgi:hypothetical protein